MNWKYRAKDGKGIWQRSDGLSVRRGIHGWIAYGPGREVVSWQAAHQRAPVVFTRAQQAKAHLDEAFPLNRMSEADYAALMGG